MKSPYGVRARRGDSKLPTVTLSSGLIAEVIVKESMCLISLEKIGLTIRFLTWWVTTNFRDQIFTGLLFVLSSTFYWSDQTGLRLFERTSGRTFEGRECVFVAGLKVRRWYSM